MSELVLNYENLEVLAAEVSSLIFKKDLCTGVVLNDGSQIKANATVICTGTFMRGVMHIGDKRIEGGRVGDKATIGISDQLASFGFEVSRLKTGTPPRLKRVQLTGKKHKHNQVTINLFHLVLEVTDN